MDCIDGVWDDAVRAGDNMLMAGDIMHLQVCYMEGSTSEEAQECRWRGFTCWFGLLIFEVKPLGGGGKWQMADRQMEKVSGL